MLLVVSTAWSSLIYYLNAFTGLELLAIPMAPVTISDRPDDRDRS